MRKLVFVCIVPALLFLAGAWNAGQAQEKKKMGKIMGEVKSSKKSPNGKNIFMEVLAPGEEKPRKYFVALGYLKEKGPAVLKTVQSAKVGDRVQLEWIDTGEGLAIIAFAILNKKENDD